MTDLSPAEIQAQAAELLKTLDTSYRPPNWTWNLGITGFTAPPPS